MAAGAALRNATIPRLRASAAARLPTVNHVSKGCAHRPQSPAMETINGAESGAQAARAGNHRLLRHHQYGTAGQAADPGREDPDPEGKGHSDAGERRYARQADLSVGAAHVSG